MKTLLAKLAQDFPQFVFTSGKDFSWSPATQRVIYAQKDCYANKDTWSLLHELAHALLGHNGYETDVSLIKLEAAAWIQAAETASLYSVTIDPEHIQDCLDTYRDWLHQRSICPTCTTVSLQISFTTYRCHNCQTTWHVSRSRLCRPYRRLVSAG